MRPLYNIIIGIGLLLFTSCGQQHQAKGVIREFVEHNLVNPSSCSSISVVKFDSTKVLNDSILNRMRTNADTIQRYQKSIKYDEGTVGEKLYVVRISYSINDTKYSDTYYLDELLTRVVAFKSN